MKQNNIAVWILPIKSVFVAPPFALIRFSFLLDIELLSSSKTFGLTRYHASHTRLYISSFKYGSWLPISFFIIFKTFSMELISDKFPGYLRTCILLHSRYVLVLLDLWNVARSCMKIYPLCGNTTHSHSLYFTVITIDAIVVFGANRIKKSPEIVCKSVKPLATDASLLREKWMLTWIVQNTRVI